MWWLIEYMKWNPFKEEEECVGGFDEKEESCDTWDKTFNRFVELVKDDDIAQVLVTACMGDHVYDPEDPYVLTYDAI